MGRLQRGNYIFVWLKADHAPPHVHIYKDGKEVAKYNLRDHCAIKGVVSKRLRKLIDELLEEGVFNEII